MAFAFVLAGCARDAPSAPATSAPVPSVSATAGRPGQLHLTMAPPYDCCDLQLGYILADGSTLQGEAIRGDIEVIVNRPFEPGRVQVVYNDVTCEGSVEIASGMESDVVLDLSMSLDPPCSLIPGETHPMGSIKHPELPTTARVGAFMPFGVRSVFVLQSLDQPDAPPAATITVDEAPWEVESIEILPGRYELSVLVDGEILGSLREDLVRGSDWIFPLRLLPRDVPRDCGDTPKATCERVIAAGYAQGLFPNASQHVTAARVRPSEVMSCMASIEAPLFDVVFDLAKPSGETEVTVGRVPDGRYLACTY